MSHPLLSKKALLDFREHFVGSTLREITRAFDAAEIDCDLEYSPGLAGERRTLVEQYYHTLDLTKWRDTRKFLTVFESALGMLHERMSGDDWREPDEHATRTFRHLLRLLQRDGFDFQGGRLVSIGDVPHAVETQAAASTIDAPYIATQLARMQSAVNEGPRLAIGTAKELIETTCKSILRERGEDIDDTADILEGQARPSHSPPHARRHPEQRQGR